MSSEKHEIYSDKALIAGCIKNDRKAQELLFRKYFPTMMSMCMKHTKNRDVAKQIVNNGFLRVFQKIEKYSFKGSFEGWIRQLVYRSLCDHFKSNSKYVQFLIFEERDMKVNETALEKMYAEDVMKLINNLPPATKKVFELYAIEGMTHSEISKTVNISEGTSKWHLSNARTLLQDLIRQNAQFRLYAR